MIERMQGDALEVFSKRVLDLLGVASADNAGLLAVLVSRFCATSVRERDSALCGGNAVDAGLVAIAVECRPDAEAGEQSAIAMSCARSSIDRLALSLRTVCWLSTSLSRGIFRASPRVNFSIALAMLFLRREPARNSL